jgi:hypothetical protein
VIWIDVILIISKWMVSIQVIPSHDHNQANHILELRRYLALYEEVPEAELPLLLADNYFHQQRTKPQRHKGRTKRFMVVLQLCDSCGRLESIAGQPQDRAFAPLGSRLLLVAAARGPGRPGLRRCHPGGPEDWQALVSRG